MKQYLFLFLSVFLLSSCSLKSNTQINQESQTTTPSSEEQPAASKKSLRDLLSTGIAQKCTWSITNEDGSVSTGEIVFKDQKFRQQAKVQVEGSTVISTVVSDGNDIYIWNDDNKTAGIKMKVEATTTTETSDGQNSSSQNIDWDGQYDYNCTPATISESDLTAPADVKFTDMSDLQKQMENLNFDALKDLAPSDN